MHNEGRERDTIKSLADRYKLVHRFPSLQTQVRSSCSTSERFFLPMKSKIMMILFAVLVSMMSWTNAMVVKQDSKEHFLTSDNTSDVRYASLIRVEDVLTHLAAFQTIATEEKGNRAVKTTGFNRTLDYISDYLSSTTDLRVTKSFFLMRNYQLLRTPTLSSSINGVVKIHSYSSNLALSEFYQIQYSTSLTLSNDVLLTVIRNLGCSDADWLAARPPPASLVALVKRGDCTFEDKARLAIKYKVAALLLYNDGTTSDRFQPISISLGQNNRVPALFLSYSLAQSLITASNDPSRVATVRLSISTDTSLNPIGNICADTPTGDVTQTILIGSHTDSVPAGPGINDNGKICILHADSLHSSVFMFIVQEVEVLPILFWLLLFPDFFKHRPTSNTNIVFDSVGGGQKKWVFSDPIFMPPRRVRAMSSVNAFEIICSISIWTCWPRAISSLESTMAKRHRVTHQPRLDQEATRSRHSFNNGSTSIDCRGITPTSMDAVTTDLS